MHESSVKHSAAHILVIDDHPEDIRSLLVLLSSQPWQVSLATDPHQGLQRALALAPSLIVLDVRMPRMTGFALCRLLRESPKTRDIPVIFLTSAGQLEERLEGLSEGGVDYVLKPFDAQEVLARIRVHLALAHTPLTSPARAFPQESSEQLLVRAATRFIEKNLAELPSLSEIAAAAGTYDKRLSQAFRQQLGCSVFTFVRQLRLRKGCELLTNSEMSVQDIAEIIGFRSACNFSTAFREQQGMTPMKFRQQSSQASRCQ